jgi:thiol-disulfide isomerase/thioredoxin
MTKLKDNLFFLNYLKAEKIYLDNEEFIFQLETHPEYPSLLAYNDALNFFNIPNITVKIEDKDVSNLPDYFIAEVKSKLAFIKKENNNFIVDVGEQKKHILSIEQFISFWSGVVLAAESDTEQKSKPKINKNFLIGIFIFLVTVAISFSSIYLAFFSFFIFSGLFFSAEAIKQGLNIESDFSNKFCNISKETDCNTIINSNTFKLFNFLSLSDISVIFFTGQLINLLIFLILDFEADFVNFSYSILLLSIPLLITSIFYQWRIAKKWCVICLAIIAVLLVELLYSKFHSEEVSFLNVNFQNRLIFFYISTFLVSLLGWLFIKPIISSYFKLKSENKKLFKFKRNYNLFKSSLLAEKKINYKNFQSNLFLGNKDAKLKITLVTNPLCKFCKETHSVIEQLVKKYSSDIRINIFFNFKLEEGDLKENEEIAKLHIKLVDLFLNKNQELFLEALGDWFLNKNYNKWFNKYGEELINKKDCIKLLRDQYQQNINNEVQFTPTVFVNEFSYPIIYDKADILLYIDDLLDDKEIINEKK